ncbi:hypothetical protein TWF102_008091 [Orbilia oligospora]|uniref:Uncharacterized protein n=1 Tax=Orbilia oligospora TaxID=2813651 RepID=A0A7C8NA28_ORBOL|nr:hypothetical protein TWF706_009827 [Orbilia oligospora]KAF3091834.1 hypothetical protein TWF103_011396 [Orbilia oligospora]KAF3110514.1 hypothetical protein TWF102_008091 [Orbilia oligospora]
MHIASHKARQQLQLFSITSHPNAPLSLPVVKQGGVGVKSDHAEEAVVRAKRSFIEVLSNPRISETRMDDVIIQYWKSLLSPDLKVTAHDIFDFYATVARPKHRDLFLPVLFPPGTDRLYQSNKNISWSEIDICSFRRYRSFRQEVSTIAGTRAKGAQFEEAMITANAVPLYLILTIQGPNLKIPTTDKDLSFFRRKLDWLDEVDEDGFIDQEERTNYLKVLDSKIVQSYVKSGSPKEYRPGETFDISQRLISDVALDWEDVYAHVIQQENSYRWAKAGEKVGTRWINHGKGAQDVSEVSGMRRVDHAEELKYINELRDARINLEIAYIAMKEKTWTPIQTKGSLRSGQESKGEANQYGVRVDGNDQVLDFGGSETEDDERLEAYMRNTGIYSTGYVAIIAIGPPQCCIHRVERHRDVDTTQGLEMNPENRLALSDGRKAGIKRRISGIAFVDKSGDGSALIDPTRKPSRYPNTYVKFKWELKAKDVSQKVTWETRTDVRRMFMAKDEERFLKKELGPRYSGMKNAEKWDYLIFYSANKLEQNYSASATRQETDSTARVPGPHHDQGVSYPNLARFQSAGTNSGNDGTAMEVDLQSESSGLGKENRVPGAWNSTNSFEGSQSRPKENIFKFGRAVDSNKPRNTAPGPTTSKRARLEEVSDEEYT